MAADEHIALFGGTFDPVHAGHLIVAAAVYERLGLDAVLFIPSANPPHKHDDVMFSAAERFAMLKIATADDPRFRVSDVELRRNGPSFTIDTIRQVRRELNLTTRPLFLIGWDNLSELASWKDTDAILAEALVVAVARGGCESQPVPAWLAGRVETVPAPAVEVSSSDIRRRIREGLSIRYLVTEPVWKFIARRAPARS